MRLILYYQEVFPITDISNATPIALLNHDISNVYYNGTNLVTTTNDPSGNQYDFIVEHYLFMLKVISVES